MEPTQTQTPPEDGEVSAGREQSWDEGESYCPECREYPKVIEPFALTMFINNTSIQIENELKRLFPKYSRFEIEIDREEGMRDFQGRRWKMHQVFAAGVENAEKTILASGEYTSNIGAAYQSLLRILKQADAPNEADLPMSWNTVSPYAEMICSSCGEMKTCMGSAESWLEQVEASNPRLMK